MTRIFWMVFKKRWYVFTLFVTLVFTMNLVLWNETTQLIRRLPVIEKMKQSGQANDYEIFYQPRISQDGEVESLDPSRWQLVYSTMLDFTKTNSGVTYNKLGYFDANETLKPVHKDLLEQFLLVEESPYFLNDVLLQNQKKEAVENLEGRLAAYLPELQIRSMREVYQMERDYYVDNLIFSLKVLLCLGVFSVFLIGILARSAVSICQDEIRALRVIGLRKKQLESQFIRFISVPVLLGAVLTLSFPLVFGIGLIAADFLYLSIVNLLLVLVIIVQIKKELRKRVYA